METNGRVTAESTGKLDRQALNEAQKKYFELIEKLKLKTSIEIGYAKDQTSNTK